MSKSVKKLVDEMVRAEAEDMRDGEERFAVYVYLPNCAPLWVENYDTLEQAERAAERFRRILAVVNAAPKEVGK